MESRGIVADSSEIMEVESTDKVYNEPFSLNTDNENIVVDYSQLRDLTLPLSNLLPPSPAFCNDGNFQVAYQKELVYIAKEADKVLQDKRQLLDVLTDRITKSAACSAENFMPSFYQQLLEVNTDMLPDKIERNEFASLTAEQAALYHETLTRCMSVIEGIEGDDNQSLFKRQGLILQMMLVLKQICNHPTQFLKDNRIDAHLSGKTEMLLDLLKSIVDANEKVLVFTQFREMGDLLVHFIRKELDEDPMFYHGGCTLKQRGAMVERFQNDRNSKIFILSLKAAGTGLNLTAATHVIHYDLWWNPAVEAQATDRAYRIGQHNNVQVYRFITQNTFEEKIDAMIQNKKHLAEMTVSTGENWIGKLSNKKLHEIFGR